MGNEIELISDGDGLAVIGQGQDIEQFFHSSGLDVIKSRSLDLTRLSSLAGKGAAAVQVGSEITTNSGRWVKLTAESAEAVKRYGLMQTKSHGVSHAMIGQPGKIQQWIQIDSLSLITNSPAMLMGASAILQQMALQEQMDAIVEYLETISEKVDDVLRNQKDAVIADMIGIDLMIDDAMTVRDQVGSVSEVTWSKVQSSGMTIARTQGYALRQLDAISEKLGKKADMGDIAKASREAEPQVREWLAVIARTFQLQDAVSTLEIDRIFEVSPDELENHRLGLNTARQNRLERIAGSTAQLLFQMEETVKRANSKVLFNPFDSPAAVKSSNQIAAGVLEFRDRLEIDQGHESTEAKRWTQAATEVRDKVLVSTTEGIATAGRIGAKTFDRTTEIFRSVDLDGDGVPDQSRAATAATEIGSAVKGAASEVAGALGNLFNRRGSTETAPDKSVPADD